MNRLGAAVVGVLVLAGGLLGGWLLRQDFAAGPKSPTDTPVVVRGGSLSFHLHNGLSWSQPYKKDYPYVYSADVDPSALSFHGISTTDGKATKLSPVFITNISTNWILTLDFRSAKTAEDQDTELQICTNWVSGAGNGCQISNNLSGKIFLVGNLNSKGAPKSPSGSDIPPVFSDETLDTSGLGYDVYCTGSSAEHSPCDHLYNVTVSALTGSVGGAAAAPQSAQSFHCVDGACDIKIGPPN